MEWTALLWPPGQRRSIRKGGPAMKAPSVKLVRCAIYTRVSTEHGLDQEFNSLDAQYEATLNVLLSFAQFEREVTSERIRDKIAASKRKGLWVGGTLPFGYEMKDGKIAIVEEEAELVRSIFRRYLELGSVNELLRDLKERNIRTKTRLLATGATRGGIPFGRGALYYLLSNHFYIGEVKYRNEILPGEQPPIMIWTSARH